MPEETVGPLAEGAHDLVVEGLTTRYHVYGSGPVCVAVPGGPGATWDSLRMPAVEEFLTMVYVEPLGTGGSQRLASHPIGYTRDRYERNLLGLLDGLSLPCVLLLGHSHGAFVAQYLALHHPDRVRGLVLYESAPVTGPEHMEQAAARVAEFAARNTGQPDLPTVLGGLQASGTATADEEITRAVRELLPVFFAHYWRREDEFREFREKVTFSYISPVDEDHAPDVIDDREALPTLTVPTLIVVGAYDVMCGPHWADELRTLIPDSRLAVLDDSGHFGHLEQPEAFADAVRDFVRSTPV